MLNASKKRQVEVYQKTCQNACGAAALAAGAYGLNKARKGFLFEIEPVWSR